MAAVLELARNVGAIVFSGLFYRQEIASELARAQVTQPYDEIQRRKILPRRLEQRILELHAQLGVRTPIFRKTTCAAAYLHGLPDPNGHWGVREICHICPAAQQSICARGHKAPSVNEFQALLDRFDYDVPFELAEGHIWTEGLTEQERYNLQHMLGYQVWERSFPHRPHQHGRASTGWEEDDE